MPTQEKKKEKKKQVFQGELLREMKVRIFRSGHSGVFCKKGALKNFTKFTGKHLYLSFSFNKVACLSLATIEETLAQVIFFWFCKIYKNIFLTEHLWTTAFEYHILFLFKALIITSRLCECKCLSEQYFYVKYPCLLVLFL